ncbi:hypothetical protein F511_02978 [Dorcoceras hygrometricum]|uniref:Uncharacterized protein n=1 Tax=Dorcoceras hygrometricum TaxID=472368 RepID=A0A2Z7CHU3_9LAMI|nr:hypothetical protein F511_02978 [Dorcoceras hygrometricum]
MSRQARRTAARNIVRLAIIVDRRAVQPVHDVQPSSGRSLCAIVRQAHGAAAEVISARDTRPRAAAIGAHHRARCAQQPSASLRSAQQFECKSWSSAAYWLRNKCAGNGHRSCKHCARQRPANAHGCAASVHVPRVFMRAVGRRHARLRRGGVYRLLPCWQLVPGSDQFREETSTSRLSGTISGERRRRLAAAAAANSGGGDYRRRREERKGGGAFCFRVRVRRVLN